MVRFGAFWAVFWAVAFSAGCATSSARRSDTCNGQWHESQGNCAGEHILVRSGASRPEKTAPTPERFAQLVEKSRAFTVAIQAEKSKLLPPAAVDGQISGQQSVRVGRVRMEGTGVVIDRAGLILTNHHVVRNADTVRVWTGGTWLPARLVGGDAQSDLAVLSVSTEFPAAARLGDADDARLGDVVMAVGFTPHQPVATGPVVMGARLTGLRVSLQRALDPLQECNYADLLESTAALQPGHSGGPLVSAEGDVIGINTASVTRSAGRGLSGYAIRMSPHVRDVVARLARGRHVTHGFVGLFVCHERKAQSGVTVRTVIDHSPADEAGVLPGDVLCRYAGNPVRSAAELTELVRATEPGQAVQLRIRRGWKTLDLLCNTTVRP